MNTHKDKWFELINQSYQNPPITYKDQLLPGFPSDTIQINTTGQCGAPTLKEAFIFYEDCAQTFEKTGIPISNKHTLLDFGIGWGRIARFFMKDLPLKNIYGIDVEPSMIDICKDTFKTDNFQTCEPHPPTSLPEEKFDFIVAYSVFSHLSEEACFEWMKEFSRILRPGGMVAVTTRGRPFFDFCQAQNPESAGYTGALGRLFPDFNEARAQYDRGEFVHSNIRGVDGGGSMNSTFYGETFIPEQYARTAYNEFMTFENFLYEPPRQTHPILFMRKK